MYTAPSHIGVVMSEASLTVVSNLSAIASNAATCGVSSVIFVVFWSRYITSRSMPFARLLTSKVNAIFVSGSCSVSVG